MQANLPFITKLEKGGKEFFGSTFPKGGKARMAEWSKAVDLRPTIVKMRGFEPLSVQNCSINNRSRCFQTAIQRD